MGTIEIRRISIQYHLENGSMFATVSNDTQNESLFRYEVEAQFVYARAPVPLPMKIISNDHNHCFIAQGAVGYGPLNMTQSLIVQTIYPNAVYLPTDYNLSLDFELAKFANLEPVQINCSDSGQVWVLIPFVRSIWSVRNMCIRKVNNEIDFSFEAMLSICRSALSALERIHQHELAHRNICPSSMILNSQDIAETYNVIFLSCGFSRRSNEATEAHEDEVTRRWMSVLYCTVWPVDHRSVDIAALAYCIFQLIAPQIDVDSWISVLLHFGCSDRLSDFIYSQMRFRDSQKTILAELLYLMFTQNVVATDLLRLIDPWTQNAFPEDLSILDHFPILLSEEEATMQLDLETVNRVAQGVHIVLDQLVDDGSESDNISDNGQN